MMMPHDHHHHFDDRHAGINYQQPPMMGVSDGLLTESMMSDLSISPDNGDNGGGGGVIATSNGGDIDAHLLPEDARPVTPSPANVQGLPMKELENALRRQLEYYFSSENLAKDTYLRSQMDKEQYVLIEIVANFQLIKNLTNDFDLIVNVLRHSSEVHVDDEGLRVKPLSKRCVVILREAPEEVKEENIKKMFEMEKCPVTLIKCEFVSAGFWYLFFASDEDAQSAFRYLKETLVTYPGTNVQIMARIKAKPIVNQRNKSLKAPNVIRPIGIVTAPSPGGSTVSNQSAAVSPVSSISGSVNNATVLMPNHVTPPSSVISESVGVASPYSSASTLYSPYPPNVPILPNSRIPQVFSPSYYPHAPAMIPLPNTSSGCYDLSSIFVSNGLAPHTYPSGVVTSLTPGGVPQTCLSVAPSGPSAHPQPPPQLQFIATSGAGGPALIAANPGPHVSNPGGGRYSSNPNYGNSYYPTHHYPSYPKSHRGGDGGHHRGGGNSNSGGQSGKSYRGGGGKYSSNNSNSNSGYMTGSYHQSHHSNHAPIVYTGYPQSSAVTYHPNPAPNFVIASNIVNNSVESHPPALVTTGPVLSSNNSNNLLSSQPPANGISNATSTSTPVNQSASSAPAISNCVTNSKDTLYATSSASTEPRECREQPHQQQQPREREPREREIMPREQQPPQRPEQREPREYRDSREYTRGEGRGDGRTAREPRLMKGGGAGGGSGLSSASGYRHKRETYASNYGGQLHQSNMSSSVAISETADSSALIRTKPERSGSSKYARNSVAGGGTGGGGGPTADASGGVVPKSSTTVERERTGSATLPAVSRPTRHGHQNSHTSGAGNVALSGVAAGSAAGTSGGAGVGSSGQQPTPEQPFNLLATVFPPLPGMDDTPGENVSGETTEATSSAATGGAASSASSSVTASSASSVAVTNHPNTDAQTTSGSNSGSAVGPTSSAVPTKSHDTSLANVVKGGGHAAASTAAAAASMGPNNHDSNSHNHHQHHHQATSEDHSANNHSSQLFKSSKGASPASASTTALLPSPPTVVGITGETTLSSKSADSSFTYAQVAQRPKVGKLPVPQGI